MPELRAQPDDTSLISVLAGLSEQGYDGDFFVDDDGGLCCRACGTCTPASSARLDGLRRIEGVSDPGDMAAVLALTCTSCGQRGTAVVRYGPEAGPGDAAVLLAIDDDRPDGLDVTDDASRSEPLERARTGSAAATVGAGPNEAIGDFGDDDQSDEGGDSDVDLTSGG